MQSGACRVELAESGAIAGDVSVSSAAGGKSAAEQAAVQVEETAQRQVHRVGARRVRLPSNAAAESEVTPKALQQSLAIAPQDSVLARYLHDKPPHWG